MKNKVLFICTHNSTRSQMSEGLLNNLYGERYEAFSAGTRPSHVNPFAVKVMDDIGIDISSHTSKGVEEFLDQDLDYVVTVCDKAKEVCPYFPGGVEHLHKSFVDPSATMGDDEDILVAFRAVRDEIMVWIKAEFGKAVDKD